MRGKGKRGTERKETYVQNLRHHMQTTLQRLILDRMITVLVEEIEAGKVLNGEESRVEGNSDFVEDVRRETALCVHHLRVQGQYEREREVKKDNAPCAR